MYVLIYFMAGYRSLWLRDFYGFVLIWTNLHRRRTRHTMIFRDMPLIIILRSIRFFWNALIACNGLWWWRHSSKNSVTPRCHTRINNNYEFYTHIFGFFLNFQSVTIIILSQSNERNDWMDSSSLLRRWCRSVGEWQFSIVIRDSDSDGDGGGNDNESSIPYKTQ